MTLYIIGGFKLNSIAEPHSYARIIYNALIKLIKKLTSVSHYVLLICFSNKMSQHWIIVGNVIDILNAKNWFVKEFKR